MGTAWAVIFWVSLVGILYTYVGYAILISLLARWRARPVQEAATLTPSVTMLVAAYNEEECIGRQDRKHPGPRLSPKTSWSCSS